ncbi:MAG: hypothetical protein KA175_17040 [Flavobacteriales bacterium]|nr:hypothetical protein [Flavobacteriales bacterium]MBP7408621.1 hypothetical protein [Flavobacteriales bacterium]
MTNPALERIETDTAVMDRSNPDLVVCRYKTGVRVDANAIHENLMARKHFGGVEPFGVIGILPEDVDFDMALLTADIYANGVVDRETRALAIVDEGSLLEKIAAIYLKYHPTKFPCQVFAHFQDAYLWVSGRIAERDKPSVS